MTNEDHPDLSVWLPLPPGEGRGEGEWRKTIIRKGAAHEVSGKCASMPAPSFTRMHPPLTSCAAPDPLASALTPALSRRERGSAGRRPVSLSLALALGLLVTVVGCAR